MVVLKSEGSTPSERLLAKLCEQSFLGFWSYPNAFREQGGCKELCDLLVMCGDDIILFSDKSCAFPRTGDEILDWCRWFRGAISDSARQLRGAERWLKQHPNRVFVDKSCTQRLPISLDNIGTARFHRVIVALGAQERCRSARGGSGSLVLMPNLVGKAHFDMRNLAVQPFKIGTVDTDPGEFHVFDDFTLPLILKELDTITDLVAYLRFKEALFRSKKVGTIVGEENLLAFFLGGYVDTGDWQKLLNQATEGALLHITDSPWELYTETSWYRDERRFRQTSYLWDRIIQEFASHAFGGTLFKGSPEAIADNEEIFRCIAREPRWARTFLASKMMERWSTHEKDRVGYRIVASPTLADTLYVFVFVPNAFSSQHEYRETRQEYLRNYCFLVHSKHRDCARVIGIASDAGHEAYRTFDVVLLEGKEWSSEMESLANEIAADLEVSGGGPVHRFGQQALPLPAPSLARPSKPRQPRTDGKISRNDRCPCGSGKKFKHCCLRRFQ